MANTFDFLGFFQANPSAIQIGAIPSLMPYFMWALILGTFFVIVYKFMTNRLYIETYEYVHKGFIVKGGRYRYIYDKKTGLEGLKSMFGNEILPKFSFEYFQKSNGIPLISTKRELRLLKINKYNYKPFLPTTDVADGGKVTYVNTLVWEFHKQEIEYLRKLKRGKMLQFIQMFAAVTVIIGMMIIVAIALYFEIGRTEAIAQGMNEIVRVAEAAYAK